jgi:hypothetical protein
MTSPQRPHEGQNDKAEGSGNPPLAEASTPMGKFRRLSRMLLSVSREQFEEQRRKYEETSRGKKERRE